jgi:hypothetical protein
MSGTDIFLSYARQDRATALLFAERLREHGFSVWWDASLHSGETFDEVIERNLRDAKAVVVLWSRASVASRWVRAEATLADRRNKLAPAIIEPCDRPIIFELTHAAELSDWTGDASEPRWQNFVMDLRRLVEAAADNVDHLPRGRVAAPVQRQSDAAEKEIVAAQAEAQREGEVHCLELVDSSAGERLIRIDRSGVRIGRTPPADVVLADRSISREHCIVGLANDELLVTDLNSTNGTYVDDVRISRATVLPVGSVLRLGQVAMRHALCSEADAERRILLRDCAGGKPLDEGRLAAVS